MSSQADAWPEGLRLRHELRPGDLGRLIALHGEVYSQWPGYGLEFEAFVARTVAEYGLDNGFNGRIWLLEADQEIIAGFHIEYSGMKFGMFYVAEFLHAFTLGVLAALLFMGGWRGPFAEDIIPLGFVYLLIKSLLAYFVLIWVRMTLPRLRIDHLLNFSWKFLVPLSLVNLVVVAFVWKALPGTDSIASFRDALVPTLALLLVNVAMFLAVGAVLREWGRRDREHIQLRIAAVEGPAPDETLTTGPAIAGAAD